MEGFEKLSTDAVAAKKIADAKRHREDKAKESVAQSNLRKDIRGPTASDLKKSDKLQKEVFKEDNATAIQRKIGVYRRQSAKFKARFAEQLKGLNPPPVKAELEEWEQHIRDIQSELGSAGAEDKFNSVWTGFFYFLEQVSLTRPELVGNNNLHSPISVLRVATAPQTLDELDAVRSELIILHESWFSQGVYMRLAQQMIKVVGTVALQNRNAGVVKKEPTGMEEQD